MRPIVMPRKKWRRKKFVAFVRALGRQHAQIMADVGRGDYRSLDAYRAEVNAMMWAKKHADGRGKHPQDQPTRRKIAVKMRAVVKGKPRDRGGRFAG